MKKFKLLPIILIICVIFSLSAPMALALDDPELDAQAAILVDLDSGRVLYEKNMNEQRSPASLTKVMTALLVLEAAERGEISLDDIVTAPPDCWDGLEDDSSNAGIMPGIQTTVREYLCCALIASANEACNVLASYVSGSVSAFVDLMNQRAAELGCANTHFLDANGLHGEGHYSTAYDLYLITKEAARFPEFMEICNTLSYQPQEPSIKGGEALVNSNALLTSQSVYYRDGYLYDGASGVKTGFTQAAGYCLISTAERNGLSVMAIVMGCDGWMNANIEEYRSFSDSVTLYDWVFNNFVQRQVLTTADPVLQVQVDMAEGDGNLILYPEHDINYLLPSDLDISQVQVAAAPIEEQYTAPIKAGTVLGRATITLDGEELGSVNLVNNKAVELSKGQFFMQRLKAVLSNKWVITVFVVILVLAALYIMLVIRYRRARREYLRRRRIAEQRRRERAERYGDDCWNEGE